MPDAFLTGGTGFVGGALLRRLVAEGRAVRALARTPEGQDLVRSLGAEAVAGDLADGAALRRGMAGCRVAFHAAGVNAMCLPDPAPLYRANVDGAAGVVEAAAAAGVPRVVHTSSAVAVGEAAGLVATEATPHRGSYLSHYERSKHLGEQAVQAAGERTGVEVVCVNPASVQGPGRTGGTARLLIGYLSGRLRWTVDATFSLVFVDDCTRAHLLAERRGVAGERYLVSGATLTVREAVALLARLAGTERRVRFLPAWTATAGAAVAGGAWHLAGRQAPVCREMARVLRHGAAYDGSRATRDLGLEYTPLEEWLRLTVEWYRQQGLVP
ncbi:MAG: NAD-dependent epimerase/dehydratase family protein [Acidobacteria bacterium]|nr:NAD-dependent epimerase/dehydratase family protein [Acidobacteriota bacterium]